MVKGNKEPKLRFKEFQGQGSWEEVKLGEIIKLQGGYAFQATKFKEKGIPIIRIGNIQDDLVNNDSLVYYDESVDFENYIIRKNDLLIAMSGATTGKIGQYFSKSIAYLNQRVGRFVNNNSNMFCYSLLKPLLGTQGYLKQLESLLVAGAQPNISSKDIESIKINISKNLKEQQKLGHFFSLLDKKIQLQQTKLTHLQQYKKGLLQQVMSCELRFKDSEGKDYPEWEEVQLGEIAEIKTGYTPPRNDSANFGGDIVWVSVSDMKQKYITDTKEHLSNKDIRESKWIDEETLLMSFKLSVGVLAITKVKCMSNEAIANFKWVDSRTFNEYMYTYLSSQDISKYGNNATQGVSLNSKSLQEIVILLPCLEEQQKIATFFTSIDQKISKEQEKLDWLKEQKRGLMQQMFV